LLQLFTQRLRAQAFGLLDTKAGVCPTPISPHVAKGHALRFPRPHATAALLATAVCGKSTKIAYKISISPKAFKPNWLGEK